MHDQEFPDKTVDELREQDEDDPHSLSDEEYEEMREGALLLLQASALGEMFIRGEITMKEYVEMVDTIEYIADDKGVTLP